MLIAAHAGLGTCTRLRAFFDDIWARTAGIDHAISRNVPILVSCETLRRSSIIWTFSFPTMSDLEARGRLPYITQQPALPDPDPDSKSLDEKDLPLHTASSREIESSSLQKPRTLWKRVFADQDGIKEHNPTVRAMQSRHLMMIAIGGTIGTGLFLSAGSVRQLYFSCTSSALRLIALSLLRQLRWPALEARY